MKKTVHAFLFVSLLAASPAFASGYFGFSLGSTAVKADLGGLGGGTIDETTTMSRIYGGYRFHPYVGLEAAFYNLASASVGQLDSGANAVSGSVDMRAFAVSGVAFVPVTKHIQALVKLGAASWKADLERNAQTASADDVDALFGLGVAYRFTKQIAGTLDWEMIDSSNPEFSTLSLGFRWEFK